MMIHETYVNGTKGYIFGESGWYEPWATDKGLLYKSLRSEYGGKVNKMYRDRNGKPVHVGWVFSKTMEYEDISEKYVREVWVEFKDQRA